MIAIAIPLALVHIDSGGLKLSLGLYRYVGALLLVFGAGLYLRCLFDLTRFGQGIASPTDPTIFLVRKGMYRRLRNPMYLGGVLFFFGLPIYFEQGILLGYAVFVTLMYHLGVVFLEEPALRARFGESYVRYCDEVPRWIPKVRS
jgi:protein-S-isoprenylcysteine O-methyltransferase Ste14